MVNTKNNHPSSTRVDNNGNTITRMHSSMKRPRAPIACIRCHHKKIRCDGEHPNCTRCTQGGILCAYPSSRRSRNTQSTSVDPFIDNLSQLEIKIQQIEADLESQRTHFLSLQMQKTSTTQSVGTNELYNHHNTPIYQNTHPSLSGTKMEQSFNHRDQYASDSHRVVVQSRLNRDSQQTKKTQKDSSKKKRSFPSDTASHQNDSNKKSKQFHQNAPAAMSTKIKTPTSLSSSSVSSLSSTSSSSSPSSASSLPSLHIPRAKTTENNNIIHHHSNSPPNSAAANQTLSQHYLFPTLDPFSCHTMEDWIQPSNQNNICTQFFFSDQAQPSPSSSQKHQQQDHPSYPMYSNFNQQNHNPPPQSLAQHPSPLVTPDYTNDGRLLSSSNYSINDSTQNQPYPLTPYSHTPASSTLNHVPSSYSPSSALLQQPNNGHIMDLYNNFTMDDLISFDSQNPTAPIMDNTVWYC